MQPAPASLHSHLHGWRRRPWQDLERGLASRITGALGTARPLPTMEHIFDAIDKRVGLGPRRGLLQSATIPGVQAYAGVGTG